MAETKFKYHIFIAHSAADQDVALELFFSLSRVYRVFLDSEVLLPGDRWDEEILKAQRESLLTLVLISSSTEASYYQREEIAVAIALSRQKKTVHRVVPVYVDGHDLSEDVPYGLRQLHGIFMDDWADMNKVAKKLRKVLNNLENELLTQNMQSGSSMHVFKGFSYKRNSLIGSIRQKFRDAFEKLRAPSLNDFLYNLPEKNIDKDEFVIALEEICRTHQKRKIPLSIVYLDLDGFSQINSRFGREVGDEVIKIVEEQVGKVCREHYFARWGKDEFVSCLSGVSEESALAFSEQIRSKLRNYPWSAIVPDLYVSGSFGIAQLKDGESAVDWIVRAIHGSIFAKRLGGNSVESGPLVLHQNVSRALSAYVS